jgi:hypothetical protein
MCITRVYTHLPVILCERRAWPLLYFSVNVHNSNDPRSPRSYSQSPSHLCRPFFRALLVQYHSVPDAATIDGCPPRGHVKRALAGSAHSASRRDPSSDSSSDGLHPPCADNLDPIACAGLRRLRSACRPCAWTPPRSKHGTVSPNHFHYLDKVGL